MRKLGQWISDMNLAISDEHKPISDCQYVDKNTPFIGIFSRVKDDFTTFIKKLDKPRKLLNQKLFPMFFAYTFAAEF